MPSATCCASSPPAWTNFRSRSGPCRAQRPPAPLRYVTFPRSQDVPESLSSRPDRDRLNLHLSGGFDLPVRVSFFSNYQKRPRCLSKSLPIRVEKLTDKCRIVRQYVSRGLSTRVEIFSISVERVADTCQTARQYRLRSLPITAEIFSVIVKKLTSPCHETHRQVLKNFLIGKSKNAKRCTAP